MNFQLILVYILAAVIISTSIIYFILASNEYVHLIEFASEGLEGEIPELQIEIALFAGSAIIYLGLLGWVLVKKLKSILPYSILIIVSTILIITYAASRTMGVPVIGVEFYIGKYDMITKVLQGIIIAISGYLIYRIKTGNRQQQNIMKKT
ncbi:MAG TPA: hypothetical protein VF222_02450 [Nitrososphaeraceae archaeon]